MSIFSPINNFSNSPAAKQVKQPRGIITINGIRVNWFGLSLTSTTYYLADSFSFSIPMNQKDKTLDFNYWASAETFLVKIYIGFPPDGDNYTIADLELFMQGNADEMHIDPGSFTLQFSGRDLTSNFLDAKTTQKFQNQTSSQIVEMFAKQYGMKTRITPTSTIVGTYYSQQQTVLSEESTQWDLMTFLAQQEDFVLFVEADTLVFEPRPDDTNVKNPFVIKYVPPNDKTASAQIENAMVLWLQRSLTLASDVSVTVRVPHGTKTGEAFSVIAKSKHVPRSNLKNVPAKTNKRQKYSFTKAGLSREQALKFAQQRLKEISQHEVKLNVSMPGNNFLKKDSIIQLTGTGTSFDQYYYADNVIRHLDMNENGYEMEIEAKNSSVDSKVEE